MTKRHLITTFGVFWRIHLGKLAGHSLGAFFLKRDKRLVESAPLSIGGRRRDGQVSLAQDVLELDDQVDIEAKRDDQQEEADDGEGADTGADRPQILNQLLLLKSVAVGGFADTLQVVLDAFEGGDLLKHLAAQLTVAVADLGKAALHGFHVDVNDWGGWGRGGVCVRGHEGANSGGEIAVDER